MRLVGIKPALPANCDSDEAEPVTVIDDYLSNVEEPKRRELERIRALAKAIVPNAEEAIVYRMPTLKYRGKPFLGFDAHKQHIGLYPYSSEVIERLSEQLSDYSRSSGAIRVPFDKSFPEELLRQVIDCRIAMIDAGM